MYEYQVGGSLSVDNPTYVERAADNLLYRGLLNRNFCYVLTSRQMGKSSLRLRMRYRLEAAGQGMCAAIDMTRLGSHQLTQEQWYQGLIFDLSRKFGRHYEIDLKTWWQELGQLPPVQKLSHFIETVLLSDETHEPLFIFLDEIDSVRELNFSVDDFFGLIRFCYNERAENSAYRRLTWALFGVATPGDLVRNHHQTPFNIGQAIHLSRFTVSDAAPLIVGLTEIAQRPEILLEEVLQWTGGQPFLTQKICGLLRDILANHPIRAGNETSALNELVRSRLIHNWESQDDPEHLRTIRDRLIADTQRSGRLLSLYQQVLIQDSLKADGSEEQANLKLTGVAIEQEGQLRVTNPIYADVFSNDWVNRCLSNQRPYAGSLDAWVASDFKDESRLLMGQALAETLQWAGDKSLSDLDYRFLFASQEWDTKMVRIELEIQEKANRMLVEAQRKAKQIIWLGYLSLALCLLISAIALLMTLLK